MALKECAQGSVTNLTWPRRVSNDFEDYLLEARKTRAPAEQQQDESHPALLVLVAILTLQNLPDIRLSRCASKRSKSLGVFVRSR